MFLKRDPRRGAPAVAFPASPAVEAEDVRRFPRIGVEMPVRCKLGVERVTVMLKDLTPYGARIEGLARQRIGEPVMLMLPGLKPKLAFVAWTEPMASGLEFERPLHENVFAKLVSTFAIDHHRRMAARDTGLRNAA